MDPVLLPWFMLAGLGLLVGALAGAGDGASDGDGADPLNSQSYGDDADSVSGTAGRDLLRLGAGDDVADGGAGNDTLIGADGNDQIAGGPGDDLIELGPGFDQNFITGRGDAAQVAGNDTLRGGDEADRIIDFLGANTLFGDAGGDLLDATDGSAEPDTPDTLYGGTGEDRLVGDNGDVFAGGPERDVFDVILGAGPVQPAIITDLQPNEAVSITVPLAFQGQTAVMTPAGGGIDVTLGQTLILRIEGVSDPADVDLSFNASDLADQTITPGEIVLGTKGDDTISTGAGDDAVFASRGNDMISTGAGDDYISLRSPAALEIAGTLGWGSNTVHAGAGLDRVIGGASDDVIHGDTGQDLILGGGGSDRLFGGAGPDYIDGFDTEPGQPDTIEGGAGDDRLLVDDGDSVSGGTGRDLFDAADYRAGDAPVTIRDFAVGVDSLSATVTGSGLSVVFRADGSDTLVLIGQRPVFLLLGLSPAELAQTTVNVTRQG